MRGREPFDLPGDQRGVLCLHGFTGSPYEMRYLGHRLNQRGMTVVGPTLPGHGTSLEDLDRTTWREWDDAVSGHFSALRERCEEVAVVGLSLGGLLALHLSTQRHDVTAIASLAAPLWLHRPAQLFVRAVRSFPALTKVVSSVRKKSGSDVRHAVERWENPSYSAIPTRALTQLGGIIDQVRGELAEVDTPLLIVHARDDHTAPFACAGYLADHVSSGTVRLRALERSFHLITVDVERDTVATEVGAFFESQFSHES